jgi:hypothetical protein
MVPNKQCKVHTVRVRYSSARTVANSSSRRLFCEYADRHTCAVDGVPMVYDWCVLSTEKKKDSCPQYAAYGDRRSTILGTRGTLCLTTSTNYTSKQSSRCEKPEAASAVLGS